MIIRDQTCSVIDKTGGLPIGRIQGVFDRIIVDEAQDLAGWDLEVIEHLLKSAVEVALIGDYRQATFSTNDNPVASTARLVALWIYEDWWLSYQSSMAATIFCSAATLRS